jgi:hypothetical protein
LATVVRASARATSIALALVATVVAGCAQSGLPAEHRAESAGELAADLANAAKIRDALTRMRAQRGRGPAVPFLVAEPKLRIARERILAGHPAREVIDDEMQLAADNGERDVATWFITVPSLEAFEPPARLLNARQLNVAIMVLRPPRTDDGHGAPAYMLLFAMADPDQSN